MEICSFAGRKTRARAEICPSSKSVGLWYRSAEGCHSVQRGRPDGATHTVGGAGKNTCGLEPLRRKRPWKRILLEQKNCSAPHKVLMASTAAAVSLTRDFHWAAGESFRSEPFYGTIQEKGNEGYVRLRYLLGEVKIRKKDCRQSHWSEIYDAVKLQLFITKLKELIKFPLSQSKPSSQPRKTCNSL